MLTIRHEPAAAAAFDAAQEEWEGADAVWRAMEWTLARDPIAGAPLNEAGTVRTYMIQGAQSHNWPTLTVIYRIDTPKLISIHDAKFEKAGFYKAGSA